MVHLSSEDCPFALLHLQPPIETTCCTFFAELARLNLIALSEDGLAEDMEDDLSSEHAVHLARRIEAWLSGAEDVRMKLGQGPLGRVTAVSLGDDDVVHPIAYASFEQALASIRVAACWYEYVGSLGYGVKTQWR
jgi:hypothetical protein